MVTDRQPQGTRCNACNRVIEGTTDDIKVACEDVVLCVACAVAAWGQKYVYPKSYRGRLT